jgi:hypothetical protein
LGNTLNNLGGVGVRIGSDGRVAFDRTSFLSALDTRHDDVVRLFTNSAALTPATSVKKFALGQGLNTGPGADLRVELRDGGVIEIDLDGVTNVEQLLQKMNADSRLEVRVSGDGRKLEFADKTTGSGGFRVLDNNGAGAPVSLGLSSASDSDGDGLITGNDIILGDQLGVGRRALTAHARGRQRVPARGAVRSVVEMTGGDHEIQRVVGDRSVAHARRDRIGRGVRDGVLPNHRDGGSVAAAHARRVQYADAGAEHAGQLVQQRARPGQLTRNRIADPNRDLRRWRVAILHDVEVMIERGHLVDFGHGHLHLGRERDQVRGRQAAEAILNAVQMLDQEIASPGRAGEHGDDLCSRVWIDRAAFRRPAHARPLRGVRLPGPRTGGVR